MSSEDVIYSFANSTFDQFSTIKEKYYTHFPEDNETIKSALDEIYIFAVDVAVLMKIDMKKFDSKFRTHSEKLLVTHQIMKHIVDFLNKDKAHYIQQLFESLEKRSIHSAWYYIKNRVLYLNTLLEEL